MSNEKRTHENAVQPVITIDTSATATSASHPGANLTAGQGMVSPSSPSKPTARKTGTRSTFCPNTLRKGTKLTDADYEFHEKDPPQPTGWFDTLCKKKTAIFGDSLPKADDPHDQSYY